MVFYMLSISSRYREEKIKIACHKRPPTVNIFYELKKTRTVSNFIENKYFHTGIRAIDTTHAIKVTDVSIRVLLSNISIICCIVDINLLHYFK